MCWFWYSQQQLLDLWVISATKFQGLKPPFPSSIISETNVNLSGLVSRKKYAIIIIKVDRRWFINHQFITNFCPPWLSWLLPSCPTEGPHDSGPSSRSPGPCPGWTAYRSHGSGQRTTTAPCPGSGGQGRHGRSGWGELVIWNINLGNMRNIWTMYLSQQSEFWYHLSGFAKLVRVERRRPSGPETEALQGRDQGGTSPRNSRISIESPSRWQTDIHRFSLNWPLGRFSL